MISIRFQTLFVKIRNRRLNSRLIQFYRICYDVLWLHSWFRTKWFNDFTSEWPIGLIPPDDPAHTKRYSTRTPRCHVHQTVESARSGTFFPGTFFQRSFITGFFFRGPFLRGLLIRGFFFQSCVLKLRQSKPSESLMRERMMRSSECPREKLKLPRLTRILPG